MRALTLKAPWGTAIARLGKYVENRGWRPPDSVIGERIAIHEGLGINRWGLRDLEARHGKLEWEPGMIVCTAVVRGWVEDDNHSESITAREAARARRSDWYEGPVGWILSDVRRPRARVKTKGKLKLWPLPPRISKRLAGPKR